jgi:hypothetical protein
MIKIYAARSMTGRVKADVVLEATADKELLEKAGFVVLCPVIAEGVPSTKQVIMSSKKAMDTFWPRDKEMIREANLVFDMSPGMNSEGVKHEIGYARYCLWKPVVRVFPSGHLPIKSSVAYYEDDIVVDSLLEAIEYSLRVHGTFFKRVKWRLCMLNKSLLKWIWYQVREFK